MGTADELNIKYGDAKTAAGQMAAAADQMDSTWRAHQSAIAAAEAQVLGGTGDTAKALQDLYAQYAPNARQIVDATTNGARTLAQNASTATDNFFNAVDGDAASQLKRQLPT